MSWAGTAVSIGSAAYGMYNQRKARKGMAGGAAQYIEPSEYGPGHQLATGQSDYAQSLMRDLSAGVDPEYWRKAKGTIRSGLERNLYNRFYGGGGQQGPGIMQQAQSSGAAFGLGPKAGVANVNKALYEYGQGGQAIDEFLAQQGVNVSQEAQRQALGLRLPTHVQGQVVGGYPAQAGQDYIGPALSQLGSTIGQMDWGGGTPVDYSKGFGYDLGAGSYNPNIQEYGGQTYIPSQPPAGSAPFSY